MQFCRGFALGVLAQHRSTAQPGVGAWGCNLPADWRSMMFGYAAWVHANPLHLGDNPADSLMQYLDLYHGCRR